jgi:hypothetical protein
MQYIDLHGQRKKNAIEITCRRLDMVKEALFNGTL